MYYTSTPLISIKWMFSPIAITLITCLLRFELHVLIIVTFCRISNRGENLSSKNCRCSIHATYIIPTHLANAMPKNTHKIPHRKLFRVFRIDMGYMWSVRSELVRSDPYYWLCFRVLRTMSNNKPASAHALNVKLSNSSNDSSFWLELTRKVVKALITYFSDIRQIICFSVYPRCKKFRRLPKIY